MYKEGEIFFINLESSKGNEERKTRPCIIVSNNQYNRVFNTVIVVPISSAKNIKQKKSLGNHHFLFFLIKIKFTVQRYYNIFVQSIQINESVAP